jgi:N utilization substance protein B
VKARRRARSIALQALYEIDSVGHPPGIVIQRRLEDHNLPEKGTQFVHQLVLGVLEHTYILDPLIQEHAPEWPLDQMACVDRNVLRIALYEFCWGYARQSRDQ